MSEIAQNTRHNYSEYGAVWRLFYHLREAGENPTQGEQDHRSGGTRFDPAPVHRQRSSMHIRNLLDENNFWDVAVESVKGDFVRGGSDLIRKELDRRPEAVNFIEPEMCSILAHCHLSYFDDGRPLSAGAVSYFLCLARIWL